MKNLKQIIALILFLGFIVSIVFNILCLFNVIDKFLLNTEFFIFLIVIFLISALGIIIKKVKKDEYVKINIVTSAKEIGPLYKWTLIVWVITYFFVLILK